MANTIVKTYTFILEKNNLPFSYQSYFNNKLLFIDYEATWSSDEGCYFNVTINIIKIYTMANENDEVLNIKNTWSAQDLPDELKVFFESGLKIHAECQFDRPFVVE